VSSRHGGTEVAVLEREVQRGAAVQHLPVARPGQADAVVGPSWTVLRILADAVACSLAVMLAVPLGGDVDGPAALPLVLMPALAILTIAARGLYGRRVRLSLLDDAPALAGAVSVAAMLVIVVQEVASAATGSSLTVAAWALAVAFVYAGRAALSVTQRHLRRRGSSTVPTLIVGAGVVGRQVADRLRNSPEYGLVPVGYVDSNPKDVDGSGLLPVLGSLAELPLVIRHSRIRHVIFAFSSATDESLVPAIRRCEALGAEVSIVPRFFESTTDRMAMERIGSLPLLGLRTADPKGGLFRVKYAIDRLVAMVLLVALAPVLLVIALAVKLSSRGPVLFGQRRVGRDGQAFDIYKFRSMRLAEDPESVRVLLKPGMAPGGVEGSDRRTWIGRLLRRTSLDELPQLLNVVRGEMSLIGPRPERPEFVALFGQDLHRYDDRHRVKSGITGWAQVHGLRGQTSIADRVDWDNFYIENWSPWLDVRIMLMTIGAVFRTGEDS
jgi:exopolysaccharide biosynthesis polyprenyl glycosylphosphotransferase